MNLFINTNDIEIELTQEEKYLTFIYNAIDNAPAKAVPWYIKDIALDLVESYVVENKDQIICTIIAIIEEAFLLWAVYND